MKEKLGINTVYLGDEFRNYTLQLNDFPKIIMTNLPEDVGNNPRDSADLFDLIQQFKSKASIIDTKNQKVDTRLFREITGNLREIKTPEEMYLLRKAIEISALHITKP